MIEVKQLSKVYGNRVAVLDVTFDVGRGEILGFLGPNGAGKTTTMRMLTGFIRPSAGTARVDGHDVTEQPLEVKQRIGYLCEAPPVYREMVVKSYLRFVADLKQVPSARQRAALDRAIQLCGLADVAHRVIGHLSKGYRQRVGLAQAIVHEPPVLILDEPTVGLDPRQIKDIRGLISELGGEQTVILSTHILPEVTMTCSRVVIINEGQVVAEDAIENLTAGLEKSETLLVRAARQTPDLVDRLASLPCVMQAERATPGSYHVRVGTGDASREAVAATVVESGAGLVELSRRAASLEQVFLKLVTEEESA